MVFEIIAYIEKEIVHQRIEVDDLARAFNMSSRQLNRYTKLKTGLTPAKLIKDVQLQLAKKIIEDQKFLSISEVALRAGFEQSSTFSTLFKKRFGISPLSFAKNRSLNA